MTAKLNEAEIGRLLETIPGWRYEQGEITRTFEFDSFRKAVSFVNAVAELAEQADHHPDIDIRYTKVRLGLVSHFAGGITQKDFDLAGKVSEIA